MGQAYKPLQGIRVLELATQMAAPCCGRHLADWGAEVIRIEKKTGDTFRAYPPSMGIPNKQDCNPLFDNVNAGKRGIVIDIKTPGGMEIMHKLLAQSDVFLTNNRPKALQKKGLDYETLKEQYPGLVYARVSSYGKEGPKADRPGQDTIAFWVSTGFSADMAVKTEHSYPVYASSGTGDFVTGIGLAFAIVCALYNKRETGMGDYVENSLFGMGLWCNSNYNIGCMKRYSGKMPKTREMSAPGGSPYLCKDGEWIMCAVVDFNAWPRFAEAVGKPEWVAEPYGSRIGQRSIEVRKYMIEELERVFLTKTSKEWDEILTQADIVHDILAHFGDFEHSEQARANGFAFDHTYPNGHETVLIRPSMTSERMGIPAFIPGPMVGEDTDDVLAELGYSEEQISALEATGAAWQIDKSLYNK